MTGGESTVDAPRAVEDADAGLEVANPGETEAPSPLKPLLARSIAAVLLLGGQVVLALLFLVAQGQRLVFLIRLASGVAVARADLVATASLISLLASASLLMALPTGVAFLIWFHRAHRNLRSFRSGPFAFTPASAVGSFFIPFVNLVRPYEAMRELWQATDPIVRPFDEGPHGLVPVGWLVPSWWLLFAGRAILSWFALFHSGSGRGSLDAAITTAWSLVAYHALTIPAAATAIALVYLIERRLDALAASGSVGAPRLDSVA